MAVPALRVPLSLDNQSFEKSINDAKSLTSRATDFLVKEFAKAQLKAADVAGALTSTAITGSFQAFTSVGVPAARGLAQSLVPVALRATAAYAAVMLVADAVGAARNQIERMVAIADRSGNLGLSPQFLQLFEGESRKLQVTTEELGSALEKAFDATKEKSPIDVSKWEAAGERVTDVELALRVYNAELEKANGKGLEGLTLFRDAQTQDDKVKAVLRSMVELEAAGQRLAALELGEKMFGAAFIDRMRQGKTSAGEILATMEKLKASQDGIFSDALVARAKAVDDQLKLSEDRLSRALKPSWDYLAETILTIKGYWSDVVDLIRQAVEATDNLSTASLREQLAALKEARAAGTGVGGIPRIPGADTVRGLLNRAGLDVAPSVDDSLRQRIEDLERQIAAREGRVYGPERPPAAPSRGTGARPTLKSTDEGGRDPLEAAIDASKRHAATLEAEAASIDATAAAQARARTVAQLEEAAKRANIAAGKANVEVTDEQRVAIEAQAAAIEAATAKLEKARVQSQVSFAQGTAFLSQSDVAIAQQLKGLYPDVATALGSVEASALRAAEASRAIGSAIESSLTNALVDLSDQTKSSEQRITEFFDSIARAIQRAIIQLLIVGPLMRALQGGLGSLGASIGLPSLSLPGNAAGTDYWQGGPTWVGENGPEVMNVPRGAQIVPNDIARARGAGGGDVTVNLIENSQRAGQTEKRRNDSGGFDLTVFVDSITARNIGDPSSATRQTLGSAGRLASR